MTVHHKIVTAGLALMVLGLLLKAFGGVPFASGAVFGLGLGYVICEGALWYVEARRASKP